MQTANYQHKLGMELNLIGPWETEWDIPHEALMSALTDKLIKLLNATPLELRAELLCGEIAPYEE